MTEDDIVSVEIDEGGRLCIQPRRQRFEYIYRAGMEVGWDPQRRCLFSPRPREWTYPMWFRQINAAAEGEYRVRLTLSSRTAWINVPENIRSEMAA